MGGLEATINDGFKNYVLDPENTQKNPWVTETTMQKFTSFIIANKQQHTMYVVGDKHIKSSRLFQDNRKLSFKIWFCHIFGFTCPLFIEVDNICL